MGKSWYLCYKFVKHSKVSRKWRLRENVVLRLMECLTPSIRLDIFSDNYFTIFRLLTHLWVNDILAAPVINKNRLRKCTLIRDKQLQKKRNVATLNSAHQAKKQCNFNSGWLERQHCDLHSFFWILWTWEICSVSQQSWKKIYSRTTTKSVPLLQPEHGFCQQYGQGCDQVLVSKWKNSRGSRLFEW